MGLFIFFPTVEPLSQIPEKDRGMKRDGNGNLLRGDKIVLEKVKFATKK